MTIAIKAFSMSLNWFAEHFSSFKPAIFFLKLKKYLDKRKIDILFHVSNLNTRQLDLLPTHLHQFDTNYGKITYMSGR